MAIVQIWVNNSLENVNKQDVADVGDTLIKSKDRLLDFLPFIPTLVPLAALLPSSPAGF